jgi:hypothetical protein
MLEGLPTQLFNSRFFKLGFALVVWALIGFLILMWALSTATPKSERSLYSDISTHVMIASSLWVDGDLRYNLEDLQRFREDYPSETGPRGLYLKQGASGDWYYAKPYIYGAAAAPLYALCNINGFIILNALALVLIGVVTNRALVGALGHRWALFVSVLFVVPTAFLPWVFVPHPDIFIAAALATGGYLLLRPSSSRALQILGAIILGAVLQEKIPFVFLIPFMILAMPATTWPWRGVISATVLIAWLLFSLPNIAIDGTLLTYQGIRLHVGGAPFPLESGWVAPAQGFAGITGHVFDPRLVAASIFGNFGLAGEKLIDFLLGRQTGIVLYFAVGFVLLMGRSFFGWGRSLWLLVGLFSYLSVLWLVFPTNGYGGAGTYGPRYLMQALPLIPLSYMGARKSFETAAAENLRVLFKGTLVVFAIFAFTIQHRIFFFGNELVKLHHLSIADRPLNAFRLERWLLPTIFAGYPTSKYVDWDKSKRFAIYKVYNTERNSWTSKFTDSSKSAFVLYRTVDKPFPQIEVISPVDSLARIRSQDAVVWSGILHRGQKKHIELDSSLRFDSAFDLLLGRVVGVSSLVLEVDQADYYTDGSVRKPAIQFIRRPGSFEGLGFRFGVEDLVAHGAEFREGWSHLEPWGVWTDGVQADMALSVGKGGGSFELELQVHGYVPASVNALEADFACNGTPANRVVFAASQIETVQLRCDLRPEDEYVVLGISIWDPTSPMKEGRGPDPRRLGVGLHTLMMDRVE